MSIVKKAIEVKVRAYSRKASTQKAAARAVVLRGEIDSASRNTRIAQNEKRGKILESA
jgi:hypothetical protein